MEQATGFAERDAALAMLDEPVPVQERVTLGADAGHDIADFVAAPRARDDSAHRADARRPAAFGGRRPNHSPPRRRREPTAPQRVEETFGWAKTVACFRKTRFRGRARTQLAARFVAAAYDLLRISKLMPA